MHTILQLYTTVHTNVYSHAYQNHIMESETIYIQKYPDHGYEVRTEMIKQTKQSEPRRVLNAYTTRGTSIGNPQLARRLCQELLIAPELITIEHTTCSIGFREKDQKWYGWAPNSNLVIEGFGIGSTMQQAATQPTPEPEPETDPMAPEEDSGYTPVMRHHQRHKPEQGMKRGFKLWTARTLDDARQMAIDFANSVA